jgi:hypothetical protein
MATRADRAQLNLIANLTWGIADVCAGARSLPAGAVGVGVLDEAELLTHEDGVELAEDRADAKN